MVIINDPPVLLDQTTLLKRAQRGDAEAFCQVVQTSDTRLFRQAVALCRDASTAEDLVSETISEAWRSLARFNHACRFSTWLYSILLHRYQKHLRQSASQPVAFSRLPLRDAQTELNRWENHSTSPLGTDEAPSPTELRLSLKAAIDRLPDKHRRVILLRFFEEASLAEIASALDCSVGTVKSRLYHALQKLRRMKIPLNLSELSGDTET